MAWGRALQRVCRGFRLKQLASLDKRLRPRVVAAACRGARLRPSVALLLLLQRARADSGAPGAYLSDHEGLLSGLGGGGDGQGQGGDARSGSGDGNLRSVAQEGQAGSATRVHGYYAPAAGPQSAAAGGRPQRLNCRSCWYCTPVAMLHGCNARRPADYCCRSATIAAWPCRWPRLPIATPRLPFKSKSRDRFLAPACCLLPRRFRCFPGVRPPAAKETTHGRARSPPGWSLAEARTARAAPQHARTLGA